jgi:hypothetical protein
MECPHIKREPLRRRAGGSLEIGNWTSTFWRFDRGGLDQRFIRMVRSKADNREIILFMNWTDTSLRRSTREKKSCLKFYDIFTI